MNYARAGMRYRARVLRDTNALQAVGGQSVGATDGWGHHTPPSWNVMYDALPCLWFRRPFPARRVISAERTAIDDMTELAVPVGTDIQAGDRIESVSDRQGNVLAGPMQVVSVARQVRCMVCGLLEVERATA